LGLELRKLGRYEEALAEFRKAEKVGGSNMVRINLRWLQEKLKSPEVNE